jgi:transposase
MPITLEKVQVERVDDLALLLNFMIQLGWPELLNQHLGRHPNQTGLDLGWTCVIWLGHLITEGDHRKEVVREWVKTHHQVLERICGIQLEDTDFTDDRLSILLRRLSRPACWESLELGVSQSSIGLYALEAEVVRHDATTVSGSHLVSPEGLFQFGHSKDDPTRPQVKVMVSSLDPLGVPLSVQVVSGEQADDGLYWSSIQASRAQLKQPWLLHVGDSKLSALETRAQIHQAGDSYLCPLPMTGKTPELLELWVDRALAGTDEMQLVETVGADGIVGVIAEGYEVERPLTAEVSGQTVTWTERVLIVYHPSQAKRESAQLDQRLERTVDKILALTPPPGRGRRVYRDLASLQAKVDKLLKPANLSDLLEVEYQQSSDSAGRERYEIATVVYLDDAIEARHDRFGWRPYVTDAPCAKLTLEAAVVHYHGQWRVESIFGRFKGKQLSIAPLFVRRDDQIAGLIHFVSLAVRVYVLIQFLVRKHLAKEGSTMVGLNPEKPRQETAQPTTERLLKAFKNWNLTSVVVDGQKLAYAQPLSPLQKQILHALKLPEDTYSKLSGLAENST